jgi:hypothetical protein
MPKSLALAVAAVLLGFGITAETAAGKGVDSLASPRGVAVPGSDYRYVAMSPGTPGKVTVVARVERNGGRLSRWWYLRGSYQVPAVAYDFSAGGLSADGGTLVLARFTRAYPPRRSRFAILDTQRSFEWGRPGRPPRARRFFDYVDLPGDFSFDAISPDGSTVYLIQRFLKSQGPDYITNYRVRALDVENGRLLPRPIVDPARPAERMQGLPITRATSPDGRWAYTLYDGDGGEPFIHALDTVGRTAVCINLPQLERHRNDVLGLRMRIDRQGRRLTVMSGPRPPRMLPPLSQGRPLPQPPPHPLLHVDTATFEVTREPATSGEADMGLGLAPASVGLAMIALGLGLFGLARRRHIAHGPGRKA